MTGLKRLLGLLSPRPAPSGDSAWPGPVAGDPAWARARTAARGGPRVLVATGLGGFKIAALVESALAVALTLRGAEVEILLCDGALPACHMAKIETNPPAQLLAVGSPARCAKCQAHSRAIFAPLGLKIHWSGDLLAPAERREAKELAERLTPEETAAFRWRGQAVGEHARAGALRYFARADLAGEPLGPAVLARYVEAGLLAGRAATNLLAERGYQVACFHHGLYVPQGPVGEACRAAGVRVVNWNPAYRRQTFIFSHGDTYHHTMLHEPVSTWEGLDLSPDLEARTMAYLKSRWEGSQDWIWFHQEPCVDRAAIAQELSLDLSRPYVVLLSSVMWDAQLHYPQNAFPDMLAWVRETIRYFAGRPELPLVIRVHPAEIHGATPSRQRLAEEIGRAFDPLPANVRVVGPESRISTYALAEGADAALIYSTKTGIELASLGLPVIVAGEAWIRGKGFSLDAATAGEYLALLDRLPLGRRLEPERLALARRYACHFFFRRMIPLPFLAGGEKMEKLQLRLDSLADLGPGRWAGLDLICQGILAGTPFIYPAEALPWPEEGEPCS